MDGIMWGCGGIAVVTLWGCKGVVEVYRDMVATQPRVDTHTATCHQLTHLVVGVVLLWCEDCQLIASRLQSKLCYKLFFGLFQLLLLDVDGCMW